jgi:predicted dehydrogenase
VWLSGAKTLTKNGDEQTMNRREFISLTAATSIGALTSASAEDANKEPKDKYRACIIGDSQRGGYGHSLHLLWALRDDVEPVALADPDEKGRQNHAVEAGVARTYADYREMLDKERPDLVAIGPRWTVHHREYLLACAGVGAHGIMEKPLAPDLEEADEMVQAAEARALKWAIAFNFRTSPVIRHVKRLVFDEGLIGQVLELRGRGKEDRRAGGEDLIVLGTHIFDMMIYFLGNPLSCMANVTVGGRQAVRTDIHEATEPLGPVIGDRIHAVYEFPNEVAGFFATVKNRDGNQGRWGLDIYGTKGLVTIRMNTVPEVHMLSSPSWAPDGKDRQWEPFPDLPRVKFRHPRVGQYAPIVDDLIESIERDRVPSTSLGAGRDSLAMIQGVFETCLHDGRVTFPLQNRSHPLKRWKD